VLLFAATGLAWAAGGLASTPFGPLLDDLLGRFHAREQPCDLALGQGDVCFVVRPGHVALLAEAFEAFVADHDGAVQRGTWSSANGAHRVVLALPDPVWGSLELWLAERPGRLVEGWFVRQPRGRD